MNETKERMMDEIEMLRQECTALRTALTNLLPYAEFGAEDELLEEARAALRQADSMRDVIRRAANIMAGGEGVQDQGEAWDRTLRLLDAAVAEFGPNAEVTGAAEICDQHAALLSLVADDKVWQRKHDELLSQVKQATGARYE